MYKRIPTQILVTALQAEDAADKAVSRLVEAMKESAKNDELILCTNLAVVKKKGNGKFKVKEYGDPSLLKGMAGGTAAGAIVGATVGGLALSFLGPIGAATGALAGKSTC